MTNSKDFKLIFKQTKNSSPVKIRENLTVTSLLFFEKNVPDELKDILNKLVIQEFNNKNNNLIVKAKDSLTNKIYTFRVVFLKDNKYKIFMS